MLWDWWVESLFLSIIVAKYNIFPHANNGRSCKTENSGKAICSRNQRPLSRFWARLRIAGSSTSSAWGIMWDCSAHAYFSAVRCTYFKVAFVTAHEKSWIFPFLCTICRLYKAVTKRYCFAEAFKKFLVEEKAILLLWNSPILTAKSWPRARGGIANKTWTKNAQRLYSTKK